LTRLMVVTPLSWMHFQKRLHNHWWAAYSNARANAPLSLLHAAINVGLKC